MKKIIWSLILVLFVSVVMGDFAQEVFAQNKTHAIPSGSLIQTLDDYQDDFGEIAEEKSLRKGILKILNFALTFLGVIAVAVIIFAGFRLVLSGGDDGAKEKAQKMILYAVVGLVVVLLSYALVNTVLKNIMTKRTYQGQRDEQSETDGRNMQKVIDKNRTDRLQREGKVVNYGSMAEELKPPEFVQGKVTGGGYNADGSTKPGQWWSTGSFQDSAQPGASFQTASGNTTAGGNGASFQTVPGGAGGGDASGAYFQEGGGGWSQGSNAYFEGGSGECCGAHFATGQGISFGFGSGYGWTESSSLTNPGSQFVPADGGSGFGGATLFESTTSTSSFQAPSGVAYTNPSAAQKFESIFKVNPIVVSGEQVVDYGEGVSVPLETGRKGVLIQFTLPAYAQLDMGDGTSRSIDTTDGSRGDFTHIYGEPGRYVIRADVQGIDGDRETHTKEIIVGALEAVISGTKTHARVDEPLDFSARNSRTIVGTVASYEWSCSGGDGCFDPIDEESVRVVFYEPGTYNVKLRIKNSLRIVDEDVVTVVVKGITPVAKYTIESAYDPMHPAAFIFDGSQSVNIDGLRGELLYRWDFDGDFKETFNSVVPYEFSTPGEKDVTLQVVQKEGDNYYLAEPLTQRVSVDSTLGVDFNFGTDSVKADTLISFQGESPKATEFEWIFPNDDRSVYGKRTQNTFNDAGAFPVTLRVRDQFTGEENEITKTVYVRHEGKPTAIINVVHDTRNILTPYVKINRGSIIQIDSKSLDDAGGIDNLRETWSVNGKVVELFQINEFFQDLGTYQIDLIASNRRNANLRDQTNFKVIVVNTPPVVDDIRFVEDSEYGAQRVRIEADATDADGVIDQYRFEALYNHQVVHAQITKAPYVYFNLEQFPGVREYYFRVTAVDNDYAHASMDTLEALTVDSGLLNNPPIVAIHALPGNAGTTETNFNFIAEARDDDGDSLTFEWDFPDGKRFGKYLNYRFIEPGDYQIVLTVSDDLEQVSRSVDLYVSPAEEYKASAEETSNYAPQAAITGVLPFHTVEVGTPVRVYSQANDLDEDDLTFQWNFGDGSQALVQHAVHRYETEGIYTLKLTVSDGLDESIKEQQITVLPEGTVDPKSLEISDAALADIEDKVRPSAEAAPLQESDIQISSTFKSDEECTLIKGIESRVESRLHQLRQNIDLLPPENAQRQELEAARRELQSKFETAKYDCTDYNLLQVKKVIASTSTEKYEIDQAIAELEKKGFERVGIDGTTQTRFFLYGGAPTGYHKALDFRWDIGDGRVLYGQNVSFEYAQSGVYRVVLMVSDGEIEVADTLTINVKNIQPVSIPEDIVPSEETESTSEVSPVEDVAQ